MTPDHREVFPSRDAGQPPVPLRLADQLGWDSLSVIVCAPGYQKKFGKVVKGEVTGCTGTWALQVQFEDGTQSDWLPKSDIIPMAEYVTSLECGKQVILEIGGAEDMGLEQNEMQFWDNYTALAVKWKVLGNSFFNNWPGAISLKFGGQEIEEHVSLSDLGIEDGATIYVRVDLDKVDVHQGPASV